MKKVLTFMGKVLTSGLLTFGLVAGSVMCLVSAFSLRIGLSTLLLSLGALSLFCVLSTELPRRWRWVLLLAVGAVALRMYLNREELITGVQLIYTTLRTPYVNAYGWTLPLWSPPPGADATMALILLGVPMTFVMGWAIHKRHSVTLPLLFVAIPLFLCFVVLDTPPGALWRNMFLLALGVTTLTQGARRQGSGGNRLVWLVTPVVLALLLVMQWLLPSEDYQRSEFGQRMLSTLLDWTSQVATIDADEVFGELDIHVPVASVENLSMDPDEKSDRTIIEVYARQNDTIYLRGMTYGVYTGNSWTLLDAGRYTKVPDASALTVRETRQVASLSLRTRYTEAVIYTPYYLGEVPGAGEAWYDVCVENGNKLREYTMAYYTELEVNPYQYRASYNPETGIGEVTIWEETSNDTTDGIESGIQFDGTFAGPATNEPDYRTSSFGVYDKFVYENYTALPDSTREDALALFAELGLDEDKLRNMNASDVALTVANAVRRSAEYDLNTPRMPAGSDFVIWFLEDSDTGYCVHFASAAAVLLRSLGIPARYVTGYLVNTESGAWTSVSEKNAHAWAEYYVPGLGWLPVEATPGGGVSYTANGGDGTVPQETEETASVTETEETTEPEETQQTTAPMTETTEPEETTAQPTPTTPNTGSSDRGESFRIPGWVWIVVAAVGLFFLRRPVTLWYRRRKLAGMKPRERFLARWRGACTLADFLRLPIEHEELAEKARFSAHDPTKEERKILREWEDYILTALKGKPWYIRFACKWIMIWI